MDGMTRDEVDDKVKSFQDWIKTQPDLPQKIGECEGFLKFPKSGLEFHRNWFSLRKAFAAAIPESCSMASRKGPEALEVQHGITSGESSCVC
jgi:hypothetical protein